KRQQHAIVFRSRPRAWIGLSLVAGSAYEEIADYCRDLLRMSLEREMARVEEMDHRVRNVALEGLGTCWQEKRIVLSPRCEEAWLVRSEVILEGQVGRNVTLVIAEEIQLNFVGARPGQIKIIERIAVWRNRGHVRHTVRVLPAGCVRREKTAKRLSVGQRRFLPIGPNWSPAIA